MEQLRSRPSVEKIYLWGPDPYRMFCAPSFLTAIHFKTPPVLLDVSEEDGYAYLDNNTKDYVAVDYQLDIKELSSPQYDLILTKKVDLAVARLVYEQKLKTPLVCLCADYLKASHYYSIAYEADSTEAKLCELLSLKRRKWLITLHYNKIYPDLDLINNQGFINKQSLPLIWQTPIALNFGLVRSLWAIPSYYLKLIYNLDKSLIIKPLPAEPVWWKDYFYGSVLDSLTLVEQALYKEFILDQQPSKFKQWLLNNQPSQEIDFEQQLRPKNFYCRE